jgi:hypothetical protein
MSRVEVDKIQQQCGSTLTVGGGASKTVTVDATTVTLGRCGGTVSLASGATQSGFGRTGTVDWVTTPKTATFTAESGKGYFCNTTAGAFELDLPAGSAGSIVSLQDYNKTFDDNNLTVDPDGTDKINGGIAGASLILSTEGIGLTFVYVDSTVGWKTVHENEFGTGGSNMINATGGTITTSGDCKIHKFTGPGTFQVCSVAAVAANNLVSYMVVGAGGSGGTGCAGGGGGAGGFRELVSPAAPYTSSPLNGYPTPGNRITVTATSYPITVGGGGASVGPTPGPSSSVKGNDGNTSTFSSITGAGGGAGAAGNGPGPDITGNPGGSGGGGGHGCGAGGSGNQPPVTPAQGSNGAASNPGGGGAPSDAGGGGGGATATGSDMAAGAGATTEIMASPLSYAGGGGGTNRCGGSGPCTAGGTGGGGRGGFGPRPGPAPDGTGVAGTANTGGGGGGGKSYVGPSNTISATGAGGSGIVVIRYKYQ